MIYPQGVVNSWNVGFNIGQAYAKKIDDVSFIRELIYRIEQTYTIDPDRIYVTGFSAGAYMAYRLGAEVSDVVAGIAPVAGSIGGRENTTIPVKIIANPSQPVSVIVFHGTADDSVDYYGKPSPAMISLSVHDSVAFWVNADGCSKTAQNTTSADGKVVKSVYSGGLKGTEVVLNTLVGGGHEWPSNATDLIWDFFMSHPKQH
jgi:polyhydroxybutyrate depolymerase